MCPIALVVLAAVAGSATSQVYGGDYGLQEPEEDYKGPSKYYRPGVYGVEGQSDYTDRGEGASQYNGDVMRKKVQEVDESGLELTRGAGGKHMVMADTAAAQGYDKQSGRRGSSDRKLAISGMTQEFGARGKTGYGSSGNTGYRKGHSNTGFHKAYTNTESGKDIKYVDQEHREDGETFGRSYGDMLGRAGSAGYEHTAHDNGHQLSAEGLGRGRSGLESAGFEDRRQRLQGQDGAHLAWDRRRAQEQQAARHQDSGRDYFGNFGQYLQLVPLPSPPFHLL